MTEHDEQRPMTRRERRLREMAETGALDLSEALPQAPADESDAEPRQTAGAEPPNVKTPNVSDAEAQDPEAIEISPVNADGSPRTRREMRQLREAALAEREAALASEAAPASETAPAEGAAPEVSAEADQVVAEPEQPTPDVEPAPAEGAGAVGDEVAEIPDFDTLMSPPTEPFSVEELREAENSSATEFTETGPIEQVASDAEVPPDTPTKPKSKLRLPWQKRSAEEGGGSEDAATEGFAEPTTPEADAAEEAGAVPPVDVVEAEIIDEVSATDTADPSGSADGGAPTIEVAPIPAAETGETAEGSGDADDSATGEETTAPGATATGRYSFPDIVPPEEWRSVFDDPSGRTVPEQGAGKDDFDDLISRAVEQEGAGGTSSTSALILPSMPEDTGGLTGPLGATGELYITGSIELPKSLGETGGHSTLHDSLQMEPITAPVSDDPGFDTEGGPRPVAAKHAVSARASSGMSVVAKPAKERSKLPLILSLTGGGLLVIVVGIGIWGATTGLFSG